jgi:amidase
MGDLPGMSAVELAGMVRSGQASAREAVEAHLARLDQVNGDLNAVITRRDDEALVEADAVDRGVADGEDLPLAGVPFTVKDLIAAAGVRTTGGSRALVDFVPRMDATAVGRLRSAGAILIGKTNCPEWGMFPYTRNERFGETKSPLGPVTVGGSSGGEAAAVQSGASALGVGTDFGGSVRWPAHCTGLFGLRPSAGRIPLTGQLPTVSLDEPLVPNEVTLQGRAQLVGPLARTVDDVEQALHVMAGPDGIDPFAAPVALGWSRQVALTELRTTVWAGPTWPGLRDDVADAIRDAGLVLERRGVDVDAMEPPGLERGVDVYSELRSWDRLQDVRRLIKGKDELVGADVRAAIEAAKRFESEPHAREAAQVWRSATSSARNCSNSWRSVRSCSWPWPPSRRMGWMGRRHRLAGGTRTCGRCWPPPA